MARSKINPSSSVTFRIPQTILEKIDNLALSDNYDRTAEINTALRHWVEIGGVAGNETITQQKISLLESQLREMNDKIASKDEMLLKLSEAIDKMERDNARLLSIIEENGKTIQFLLKK